ncbi:MAG: chromate efflux transporter [Opitutae bacterium]|nr:chromate efflux transporter [Opitutae bacterium]
MSTQPPLSAQKIFMIYLRLGCLSFGGPVAHFGYFKEEFVSCRKWLSAAHYTELLALCQFVPGPSSSQLGFAIALQRGGLWGACAAWLGFTLPSALIMIACAYGLSVGGDGALPLIHGLLIAAVAVVAKAVLDLGKKLCPDWPRIALAGVCAALSLSIPGAWIQMGVILLGVAIGNALFRNSSQDKPELHGAQQLVSKRTMYIALTSFCLLLAASLLVSPDASSAIYGMNYRAGAMVFGGGHVVLPLLYDSVVPSGLISESHFVAGYSAAQALPGPLFTLSAFLGTASQATSPHWIGGAIALLAIFLPGILLLIGLLPLWNRFRNKVWAQAGLIGANAAVVGLLLAALINPVWAHGVQRWTDVVLATGAFIALSRFKIPAWLVVLCCAACGYLIA